MTAAARPKSRLERELEIDMNASETKRAGPQVPVFRPTKEEFADFNKASWSCRVASC